LNNIETSSADLTKWRNWQQKQWTGSKSVSCDCTDREHRWYFTCGAGARQASHC